MKAWRELVPGFLLETPRSHEYFQITFLSKLFHLLYAWSFLFPLKDKGLKNNQNIKSEKSLKNEIYTSFRVSFFYLLCELWLLGCCQLSFSN